MSTVAIITARGGSKRIPGKNIRPFLGKPIIAYSIHAALKSGLFDTVMVSTDDEQIADVAVGFGAEVPFLRSQAASDDFATTSDAITDVLDAYQKKGQLFTYACCIYPTAPFVTAEKLAAAYHILRSEKVDTVFPVMPFSYPVFRALKVEGGRLRHIWNGYENARSQDLPPAYHDAGQFYFFDVAKFLTSKSLLTTNTSGIVISELEGQDIDTLDDWKLAELKFSLFDNQRHE